MPQLKQGFVLEADGKASSVNMATLVYGSWKLEGRRLILSGRSLGNRQTIGLHTGYRKTYGGQSGLAEKRSFAELCQAARR